ncbi:MAG: polyprenyl synthetase family protein [Spirochaetaceae bacterium]|jgi:geranylgeranyl diphosphate synthase type I|nr:polyprenyl synthetase family protein [Spirochaetaceae bacterium]
MKDYFNGIKEQINYYLDDFFKELKDDGLIKKCRGEELLNKLLHFSSGGKMIRGGLVSFSYQLFDKREYSQQAIALGAALELLQSALLIHDDIMDKDTTRRSMDTLYHSYSIEAEEQGLNHSEHQGISMGICAGDVSFFMAFEIINRQQLPLEIQRELLQMVSREMSYVGMAQMNDVWSGAHPYDSKEENILNVYRYKTGRYTFSLPLMLGAVLAGENRSMLNSLAEIGELLGIIFQIKDDELGLWADEKKLGKPVGSDIMEGKKTLYYHYLYKAVNEGEREEIIGIFGNEDLQSEDIQAVLNLLDRYSIRERVNKLTLKIKDQLLLQLETLPPQIKESLTNLIEYNLQRKK